MSQTPPASERSVWRGTARAVPPEPRNWPLAAVLVFGALLLWLRFEGLPSAPLARRNLPALAVACVALVVILRLPVATGPSRWRHLAASVFALSVVAAAPFAFMQTAFGFKAIEPIVFYLPDLSAGDTTVLALEFHLRSVVQVTVATLLVVAAAWVLALRLRHLAGALVVAAALLAARHPLVSQPAGGAELAAAHALIVPHEAVRPPVILATPARPRNLLLIYLEGFERTLAELPFSRAAFARVSDISAGGLEVTGIRQLAGLNYSAAGLVATQCGVPLLPRGFALRLWLETPDYIHRRGFMPTVVCLGDVLSAAGYRTVFLNGSDLSMFAIRAFLQTHGFDTIVEFAQFQGQGLDAHRSVWGYDDHALMIRVDQELGRLAGGAAPFLLAYLTIGTHGPDGVLDASCDPVPPGVPALPTAVACAVGHLDAVLAMLDRHGLAGDTVVAVMSDHLMMENTLQAEFDAVQDRRENLFFLLNAGGPGQIARTGSMLDIYPTLLEALGYRLEGGRAGLGQSFLSPAPTLLEALGEQTASAAIWRHLALAEWLWRSPDD